MKNIISLYLLVLIMGVHEPAAQTKYSVTFRLKTPVDVSTVHVTGDFNQWSRTANPLIYTAETDSWESTVELPSGRYEYRFLINQLNWIKDPANPHWGGENSNSILTVLNMKEPVLKNLKPVTGSMIAEDRLTISAEYWDGFEKNGIDVNAANIYLDQIKLKIEYVPERNMLRTLTPKITDGEHEITVEAMDAQGNRAIPLDGFIFLNADNSTPMVDAGYTIIAGVGEKVSLNSGDYHDPDLDLFQCSWRLISRPEGSKIKLENRNAEFPSFTPDQEGRYVFGLKVSDGKSSSAEDSMDVYAFMRRKYPTEFTFNDSTFMKLYESSVDCVTVAGEFNQWSGETHRMSDYNHDGIWTAWVDLDPGEYEYKFVVNDKHWIPDLKNPLKISDGWSGLNSIKKVTLNLAPHIEIKPSFRPGKLLFNASDSYSKTGKQLLFHWYQDINNPERYLLKGDNSLEIPIPKTTGEYFFYLVLSDHFGSSAQKTIVLKVKDNKVQIQDFSESPDWSRDAIVYEIFVKNFTPEGTLKGVISKIPYIKTLGINCIWLMPIFESPTEDGYGVTDFHRIDPQYGDSEDLKDLIRQAHEAGIKVILDFVANHTSDQHAYFVSAFQNPYSIFRSWYVWNELNENQGFYTYQFHNDWDRLPNLNYRHPQVRHFILEVAQFWANFGIDGYRCDVAWGVPHDFWKLFRRKIKNINPDFLLLNETLPRSARFHEDEFDMSYDTEFYGSLLDVVRGRKPVSAIQYGLDKTNVNYPSEALSLRYIENHDMDRFISQFSASQTKLAATLLLTVPGTPMILYGQEFGFREKLPQMEWSGVGEEYYRFYQKLIALRRNHRSLRRGNMIKLSTDSEEKVYAFLRTDETDSFLIVLNFAKEEVNCQLVMPSSIPFKQNEVNLDDMITGGRIQAKINKNQIIRLNLQPGTSYVYRIW